MASQNSGTHGATRFSSWRNTATERWRRTSGDTATQPEHLVRLLQAVAPDDARKVFVVGHGWGANIAWHLCLFRLDKVKALVNLSVPFSPRHPKRSPVEGFRMAYGDDHYICRFQEPDCIEAEFAELGVRKVVTKFLTYRTPVPLFFPKGKGFGDSHDTPIVLPLWLTEEDVQYYVSKFEKSGFTGGVNYYRAFNLTWELTAPWTGAQVKVPTKFAIGELDLVYHMPGRKEYIHNGGFQKKCAILAGSRVDQRCSSLYYPRKA